MNLRLHGFGLHCLSFFQPGVPPGHDHIAFLQSGTHLHALIVFEAKRDGEQVEIECDGRYYNVLRP